MGKEVGQLLGEISEDEVAAGRPMLSSVVVSVDGKPGPGFFTIARRLGRLAEGDDEHSFWGRERAATYDAWRRPLPEE